jgi:hypothetical protein
LPVFFSQSLSHSAQAGGRRQQSSRVAATAVECRRRLAGWQGTAAARHQRPGPRTPIARLPLIPHFP